LSVTGDAETQMLHRGIYDAAVFRAQIKLSGKFTPPDFGAGRLSLCRTLDQVWRALSRARIHDLLSFRSYRAAENSSVPISDGRRDALYLLSAAALDLRVYRIRLCVSDRGGGIDNIDHVVLPIFPRRRREDINDRRWPGRSLHVSLHYFYGNRITRF
jgi:hypothetical protein